MQLDVETISYILVPIATVTLISFILILGYNYLRPKFPITVNCWFCNQNTKVSYVDRNQWNCFNCKQYNGFNKDGDYNKSIPEQHDELLNSHVPVIQNRNCQTITNGLCSDCNNNQRLKIHQLANFIPLRESNYDAEIEHFQKQLERAYKLCPKCEETLKQTLHKQNIWLLGLKFIQNGFNRTNVINIKNISAFQKLLLLFTRLSLSTIALIHLVFLFHNLDYSNASISETFPNLLLPYIFLTRDLTLIFINTVETISNGLFDSSLTTRFIEDFIFTIMLTSTQFFVCLIGLAFQILYMQYVNFEKKTTFFSYGAWLVLSFLSLDSAFVHFSSTLLIQICTIFAIIATTIIPATNETKSQPIINKVHLQKMKTQSMHENKEQRKPNINNYIHNSNKISPTKSLNTTFHSLEETLRSSTPDDYKSVSRSVSPSNFDLSNNSSILNKSQQHIFGQAATFENILRKSPTSFCDLNNFKPLGSPTPSIASSVCSFNSCIELDLNKSLDELHLGVQQRNRFSPRSLYSKTSINAGDVLRPRPVLSPSRLKPFNQNSWTNGFWKNEETFSRSSSQSSGYSSQMYNSLPPSRNNSICGEFDRFSLLSESVYYPNPNAFARVPQYQQQQIPVYPVLKQDAQILIQPKISSNNFVDGLKANYPTNQQNSFYNDRNSLWNESMRRYGHYSKNN